MPSSERMQMSDRASSNTVIFRYSALLPLTFIIMPVILLGMILYFASLSAGISDFTVVITFIVFGAIILLLGVSPLLTAHEIGSNHLTIRQGWYFQAEIPLKLISHAEPAQGRNFGLGVRCIKKLRKLYVLTSDRRMVSVALSTEIFVRVLGSRKIIGEIIINVNDPAGFVAAINKRTAEGYGHMKSGQKAGSAKR